MATHLNETLKAWSLLENLLECSENVVLDGENHSLTFAHVVAVSRYGACLLRMRKVTDIARFSVLTSILNAETITRRMQASVEILELHLRNGEDIYGSFAILLLITWPASHVCQE